MTGNLAAAPHQPSRSRVAMLLSADSFEKFFGGSFGIDRAAYLHSYRNDFAWEYAQGLADAGHPVLIYIYTYGPAALHDVGGGIGVRFLRLPAWLREADRLLFRLPDRAASVRLRAAVQGAGAKARLLDALRTDQVDLLYAQEFWTPRFDVLARDVTSIPVIGADHGAPHDPRLDPDKRNSLRLASKITCQSDDNLRRAAALGADAVLLTNGIDDAFFTPAPEAVSAPREILMVGRLVEGQKRFSDVLRALALLPDYALRVVGSGPDEPAIRAQAKALGVERRVQFMGFVRDREALRDYYRGCGVYVSASAWEAVQLTMLEAMSCGAAAVATRIATFERLIEDRVSGRLVPVGDPPALAAAVEDAYRNRLTFGARARATVREHYAAARQYGRLSDLIEHAVASRARPHAGQGRSQPR